MYAPDNAVVGSFFFTRFWGVLDERPEPGSFI
jgi:hypothetical protein